MRNLPARRPSALVRLFACVALALLAGCATASKRYEQGVELEQRGRAVDAARRYVEALRKEPGLANARQRLGETGGRAVDDLLREAVALDAAGSHDEAAEALLRLDALRRDAAGVGVQLAAPGDYAARRRFVFDRAIEAAVAGAAAPGSRGWSDALRRLERAGSGLEPSAEQRERLERGRAGVYLAWGESEASRGRYREAYDVAERGLRALGRSGPEAGRLADFQADVLRRGTVRVAVLPLAAGDERRRRLDEELLPETGDVLAERFWPDAPPFVEVVDPQRVAREARREGFSRRAATAREAARLARALGADFAVVAEVDSVRVEERDARETRRRVRTREGADTAYTLREGRREAWARVALTLVDAEDARVLDRATATASRSDRFRRGVYPGDWRTLDLPRDDRGLFAANGETRDRRELALDLAGGLAERTAREVFDVVLRQVP
jgi:tetratricopeptide (TPR) repeat protein